MNVRPAEHDACTAGLEQAPRSLGSPLAAYSPQELGELVAVVWREDEIEAMVFIATAAVMLVVTFGRIRGLPVGGIMLGFRPSHDVLSGIA